MGNILMKKNLSNLRNRLNELTSDDLDFIDVLFKNGKNLSIKMRCISKLREIHDRLDEVEKLHSKSLKSS